MITVEHEGKEYMPLKATFHDSGSDEWKIFVYLLHEKLGIRTFHAKGDEQILIVPTSEIYKLTE